MARDVSTLTIELKAEDKASSVFDRVGGALRVGVVAAAAAATAAIAALAAAFRSGIAAASEQEEAVVKLGNALADLGPKGATVSKALVEQAEALQKVTKYGDEAIIAGQAFAATFIKSEDTLKAVTQSAVDLAAGLGIDLQTAFELLTKASQGQTQTLARYGIVLTEGLGPAEKFAELQRLIAERMGGRAAADAKTYSGALEQLGNAWGDLLEAIGDAVIKNDQIVAVIGRVKEGIVAAIPQVGEFAKTIVNIGVVAAPAAVRGLQGLGAVLTSFALVISLTVEGFIKLGRGMLFIKSLTPGLRDGLEAAAAKLKEMDDALDPFQQKAAKLAAELGRAALGIEDFGAASADAAPKTNALTAGISDMAAAAENAGPAFTTYRTAAQLAAEAALEAAEATESGAGAFDDSVQSVDAYATAIDSRLIPALQRAGAQATATAAAVSGVFDRAGNELPAGGTLSLGGTRYDLPGGGSRLVGAANGVRNPASNIGVNYQTGGGSAGAPFSGRYTIDTPQYGTIEAFKVASYGFGPSGAGVSTYGVLPGGRIVLLREQ